ncbi:MAG: hypothetical protein GYA55_07640, partial [SAR324 cluster bacterium]|nr:hypothetical protein [SAR324 cluster bacterium]
LVQSSDDISDAFSEIIQKNAKAILTKPHLIPALLKLGVPTSKLFWNIDVDDLDQVKDYATKITRSLP